MKNVLADQAVSNLTPFTTNPAIFGLLAAMMVIFGLGRIDLMHYLCLLDGCFIGWCSTLLSHYYFSTLFSLQPLGVWAQYHLNKGRTFGKVI